MSRDARVAVRPAGGRELTIDWIACDGYGVCGDLAPDLIELDDWRYPIIPKGPVPAGLLDDARRAVDCCPMKALALRSPDDRRRRPTPPSTRS